MAKYSLFIFVSIYILSCTENTEHSTTESGTPISDSTLYQAAVDSVALISKDSNSLDNATDEVSFDTVEDFDKLRIFPMHVKTGTTNLGIVIVTESYRGSEHSDSLMVDDQYLGNIEIEEDNHHIMSSKYRKRFFEGSNIHESDFLFLYNLNSDSIVSYRIKDLDLAAFLTPYGIQGEAYQYDYIVAFQFGQNPFPHQGYNWTFAYIGKFNPFVKSSMVPIRWSQAQTTIPDKSFVRKEDSVWIDTLISQRAFKFNKDGYNYLVQDLAEDSTRRGFLRQLTVRDSKSNEVVLNEFYYDSEGTGLAPLNEIEGQGPVQWSGYLFKGKAPVVFGFMYYSIGCESFSFLDPAEKRVRILCDNRH